MSVTPAPTLTDDATATRTSATKVAAAAAVVLAVSLFVTVASIDVPHEASDAELLAWWQTPANRLSGLVSGLAALVVAVSVPVVMNHLHGLPAGVRSPQWLAYARSMGAAVTAVWLVTGAVRATLGHLVDTMDEPLPAVDVLRYSTGLNYSLLGQSGMAVLALCMLAVSVVVLRTGVLGRWLGWVGAACAVVTLGAVAAQLGAWTTPLAILWSLCLAVAVWRGPRPA